MYTGWFASYNYNTGPVLGKWPYDFGIYNGSRIINNIAGWDYQVGVTNNTMTNAIASATSSSVGPSTTGLHTFVLDAANVAPFTSTNPFTIGSNIVLSSISCPEIWIRGIVTSQVGNNLGLTINFTSAPINGIDNISDWRIVRNPAEGHSSTTVAFPTSPSLTSPASITWNLAPAPLSLQSLTWAGGVVTVNTINTSGTSSLNLPIGSTFNTVISNVNPTGYNGTYLCTVTDVDTFTYPLASNPGVTTGISISSITTSSQSPGYQVTVTTTIPHGLTIGTGTIILMSGNVPTTMNGLFYCNITSANTITIYSTTNLGTATTKGLLTAYNYVSPLAPAATSDFIVNTPILITSISSIGNSSDFFLAGIITNYNPGVSVTANIYFSEVNSGVASDWQLVSGSVVGFSSTSLPITTGTANITLSTTSPYWNKFPPSTGTLPVYLSSQWNNGIYCSGTVSTTGLSGNNLTINITSLNGACSSTTDWVICGNLPSDISWDQPHMRMWCSSGTISNWDFRGAPANFYSPLSSGTLNVTNCAFDLSRISWLFNTTSGHFFSGAGVMINFNKITYDGCASAVSMANFAGGGLLSVTYSHLRESPADLFWSGPGGVYGNRVVISHNRLHIGGSNGGYVGSHPDIIQLTALPRGDNPTSNPDISIGLEVSYNVMDGRVYKDNAQLYNSGNGPTMQSGQLVHDNIFLSKPLSIGNLNYPWGNGLSADNNLGGVYQFLSMYNLQYQQYSAYMRANSTYYGTLAVCVTTPDNPNIVFLFNNGQIATSPAQPIGMSTATVGASNILDGGITWSCIALNGSPTTRQNNYSYSVGNQVIVADNPTVMFQCSATSWGRTSPVQPTAMTTAVDSGDFGNPTLVSDGGVVWLAQNTYARQLNIYNNWIDGAGAGTNYMGAFTGPGFSWQNNFNPYNNTPMGINWDFDGWLGWTNPSGTSVNASWYAGVITVTTKSSGTGYDYSLITGNSANFQLRNVVEMTITGMSGVTTGTYVCTITGPNSFTFPHTNPGAITTFGTWSHFGRGTYNVINANQTLPSPTGITVSGIVGQPTKLNVTFSAVADSTAAPTNITGYYATGYMYSLNNGTKWLPLTFTGTTTISGIITIDPSSLAPLVSGTLYNVSIASANAIDQAGVSRNMGLFSLPVSGTTT